MGNARFAVTRMTMSIGVAVLMGMAPVVPVASASSSDVPPPDKTALIMGVTTIPTWHEADVKTIMDQFIAPTHRRQTIEPVAVTTPEEFLVVSGLIRLFCLAVCDQSIFGPGGAAWPDEPWWKLSGLFDLTFDQSVQAGVADLETAMTKYGNDDLVIYGYSQGAAIANREKQRLAAQYPDTTTAPDIDFVLGGDPNLPNGGLAARFPGLYIPILGWTFSGPEPTDTPFDTVVVTRQYDLFADFPLYPLNVVSFLNAFLGGFYLHSYAFDVSLASDPSSTSPPIKSQHGDTTYYFFPTQDLPLFAPLRTLGVPESVIDVVEPFFREIVELGYDRSIPAWQPTPARLIPTLDPGKVATDLVEAVVEGVNNALALVGSPPLLSVPAAPATDTHPSTLTQQTIGTYQPTPDQQAVPSNLPTPEQQAGRTNPPTPSQQGNDTHPSTLTQQTIGANQPMPDLQTVRTHQSTPSQRGNDTGQATSSKQRGDTSRAKNERDRIGALLSSSRRRGETIRIAGKSAPREAIVSPGRRNEDG